MTPEEYTEAAARLARDARMPDPAAERVEAVLARAFEASVAGAGSEEPAVRWQYAALAVAAALVLASGAGVWYLRTAGTEMADRKVSTTQMADLNVSTTEKIAPSGLKPVTTPKRQRTLPPVVRPQGFVQVPAAAQLPEFESGLIVRVSLPVASLPYYGVDISPASSDQPVEADVLVGQDGRARAIRLMNTSRSQQ